MEPGSGTCEKCGQATLYGRHVHNRECSPLLATLRKSNQVQHRESDTTVTAIPVGAEQPSKLQFTYRKRQS